jgi:hypothetical protein
MSPASYPKGAEPTKLTTVTTISATKTKTTTLTAPGKTTMKREKPFEKAFFSFWLGLLPLLLQQLQLQCTVFLFFLSLFFLFIVYVFVVCLL